MLTERPPNVLNTFFMKVNGSGLFLTNRNNYDRGRFSI